jgi:hypothetical protein
LIGKPREASCDCVPHDLLHGRILVNWLGGVCA